MRKSAGLLVYRRRDAFVEVFLVHPGGPFWKGKEAGAWSIPKGEFSDGEDPLCAAVREFSEETGQKIDGDFVELRTVQQKGGKQVLAWAVEGNDDAAGIQSNHYRIEWPPKSRKWSSYPEVDKAAWFKWTEAKKKINPAQTSFIDELIAQLKK